MICVPINIGAAFFALFERFPKVAHFLHWLCHRRGDATGNGDNRAIFRLRFRFFGICHCHVLGPG
jgi:hypothetical protein